MAAAAAAAAAVVVAAAAKVAPAHGEEELAELTGALNSENRRCARRRAHVEPLAQRARRRQRLRDGGGTEFHARWRL